jgi:hypothetical protein
MTDLQTRIWWVLRVGAAACFIGHGAFGVITKEAWLPYFALVGIGRDLALTLMPLIGIVDISAGLILLVRPIPAVMLYMAIWGLWTALLRPLAGQPFAEAIERAGNYGVPFALLLMIERPRTLRQWFAPVHRKPSESQDIRRLALVLMTVTATLVSGHALLALAGTPLLAAHVAALGVGDASAAVHQIGMFEVFLAAVVIAFPSVTLAGFIVVWKVVSEALFLVAGDPVWEFVERGGSYAAPLALLLLARAYHLPRIRFGQLTPNTRAATFVP